MRSQVIFRKHHYKQSIWRWWNFNWAISNPKRWCCESAALNMPASLENSAVATGLEKSVFIPIPKKGNAIECSNYRTIAPISHASRVMLKILQARHQQYVNRELPVVHAGFRNQIANICWITGKVRQFQKIIYFCFIDYIKAFDCVDHNKLWKILQQRRIPDHLTCLRRNVYRSRSKS